jgi:Phospholipase_D-nuclease N-terminal
MLAARGAVGLFLLALWLYCIVDVITTDESKVRHLPKLLWLVIVLFIPDIGSIIWLVAGRPEKASFRIGDPGYRPPKRPLGPEDQANFGVDLDGLSPIVREREEQAQLRLREEQLRRREQEQARKEREAEMQRREDEIQRLERELGEVDPPTDPPPSGPGGSKLEE